MLAKLAAKMARPFGGAGDAASGLQWHEGLTDASELVVALTGQDMKVAEGADGESQSFWVFRFELSVDGARRLEFQESFDSATEKHTKITESGLAEVPPMPAEEIKPQISADDPSASEAAAVECGKALASYYSALFGLPASQASELVRELFAPTADARNIEIDQDADGVLAVAKQMAGKLSQGANLQYLQIPPRFLAPHSTLEKTKGITSHLEALLQAPAESGTDASLERMLAVVRWMLSTLSEEPFGLKPYNPVLGEVFRGVVPAPTTAPDAGPTVMVAEQISHHPPISATHVHNAARDVSISGSMEAVPRFWGNSVEVEFLGLRVVRMGHAGETFTMNTPSLCFRGIFGMGRQFTEWSNEVVIQCEQSGLTATIDFVKLGLFGMRGEPNTVSGTIRRDTRTLGVVTADYLQPSFETAIPVSAGTELVVLDDSNADWFKVQAPPAEGGDGKSRVGFVPASFVQIKQKGGTETLFTLQGRHDQAVTLREGGGGDGAERPLFDRSALPEECSLTLPVEDKRLPKESGVVWGALTAALHAKDWATARQAKTAVEQAERELRKQREAAPPEGIPGQLGPFTPQFFELPEGGASDWAVADGVLAACLADCS